MSSQNHRLTLISPNSHKSHQGLFIYLPGMDGTGRLLSTQTDIGRYFDVRCLVIPPDNLDNWEQLSLQVVNLVQQEIDAYDNSDRPIYLCGESFGACLALCAAVREPKLFQRLIIVNPASSFQQRPWLSWGVGVTEWMPEALHQRASLLFLPFLAALNRIEPKQSWALLKAMRSVPPKTVAWRVSLLRDFPLQDRDLQRLIQPTLILAGGADLLLPSVEEGERLVKIIPQAQMITMPHSGHACLIEKELNLYQIMQQKQLTHCYIKLTHSCL